MLRRALLMTVLAAGVAAPAVAQQAPAGNAVTGVDPSGRARTAVTLRRGRAAAELSIDYGVPALRGRSLESLAPAGRVWRLGANASTTLETDADLTIGGQRIPAGTYSLFAEPGASGWTLIVNKQSGQWGTNHDAAQDLVRIPLQVRRLAAPVEALTIWLVPDQGAPTGRLVIAWGNVEASTTWSAR